VNDDTSLTSSLDYITQYTRHHENSEVKALECIYKMLATRQGDKQDALSEFHHLDVSKSQSFNFKMLVYKLKDAFNDI
jgi:hypothetical protein